MGLGNLVDLNHLIHFLAISDGFMRFNGVFSPCNLRYESFMGSLSVY